VALPVAAQTAVPLHGNVVDTNGHIVVDKSVRIENSNGTLLTTAITDDHGVFTFTAAPAAYIVRISFDTPYGPVGNATIGLTQFSQDANPSFLVGGIVECGPCVTVVEPLPTEPSVSSSLLPKQPPPARPSPAVEVANSTFSWEYGALLQGGVGLEQRTNFGFLLAGGHLGRVLTSNVGPGLLRGNFEYAVEVFPFWQSYTPTFQRIKCAAYTQDPVCSSPYTVGGTFTGASITPIMLRWNFVHGGRFMPWVQAAGGVLWTNHKYPAVGDLNASDPTQTGPNSDTSVWNFTPQGGIGAHYFVKPKRAGDFSRRSFDFSLNGVHISSASLGDKNPGVNVSLQLSVGYTWWK
jgi:hypothetical protein